jgi:hypothetical protein
MSKYSFCQCLKLDEEEDYEVVFEEKGDEDASMYFLFNNDFELTEAEYSVD